MLIFNCFGNAASLNYVNVDRVSVILMNSSRDLPRIMRLVIMVPVKVYP